MKSLSRLATFVLTLVGAVWSQAATYTGTVVSVEGDVARVAMNGNTMPSAGAKAEIFFKMAGFDDEISVATGSALKIDRGELLVKIEEATGTVEKGHLVRFGPALPPAPSASPQSTSSPSPPSTSSITGAWSGIEPGGDEIVFTFTEDGSVTYVWQKGKKKNTLRGKYRTDCATTPCRLEIFSFQVNGVRVKGQTIVGLFELHDLEMKFDLSKELQRAPDKGFTKGMITLSRTKSEPSAATPSPPPVTTPPIDPAALELGKRGMAQYSSGDYAGAIASYTEAIRLVPGAAVLYLNRANAYLYTPNFNAAMADANKALELKVDRAEDAYTIRGTARAGLGDYHGAIADCNQALKLNPKNALAYNNRANNKLRLRDYSGALSDCNRSIALGPNSALPYYNRGFALTNLGDQAGALADWMKAVQLQASFGAELNPKIQQLQALGVRPKQTGPVRNVPRVNRR